MKIYSVEHWQNNFDDLIERVENGEHIGIRNEENGHTAVMIPADDQLLRIYTDHDEAS
jgi:antitoxin (DNA-binding transcriptional repressor) of toxin-antitoxin stability system